MLLGAFRNVQNDGLYQVCLSQFVMASLMDEHERMAPEKKTKQKWLLFRLFRAANLTSGASMCPMRRMQISRQVATRASL